MRYQIVCYVPADYAELVKKSMFSAGAGRFKGYGDCCWQTSGRGQFVPEKNSNAFLGTVGKVEMVEEVKLEIFCDADCVEDVIEALIQAHPYEVPAYGVFEMAF